MARPVVGSFAEAVYAQLFPYTSQDEKLGWPLLIYLGAICDSAFQIVDDLGRDSGGVVGWGKLLDPTTCPDYALPWLGQLVGVDVDQTLSVPNQRLQIQSVAGWSRGTPASIIAAAQAYLSGTKFVSLQERFSGNAYWLGINTHTAETPADTTAMIAAITAVKPAGIILFLNVTPGQTFGAMLAHDLTFQGTKTNWPTFDDLRHG